MKHAKIETLSDWEWTTLVGAWRYYESRCSISAARFPGDVVKRFWGSGRYATDALDRIARQFAVIDHGINGEMDWNPSAMSVGHEPWVKFFAFCKAWNDTKRGFSLVAVKDGVDTSIGVTLPPFVVTKFGDGRNGIPCFRCETNNRLCPAVEYVSRPQCEVYMDEDMVEVVGCAGYKTWWGEVAEDFQKLKGGEE